MSINLIFKFLWNLFFAYQIWWDPRLVWDPDDYEGLRQIIVPPTMLWLPSCVLDNVYVCPGSTTICLQLFVRLVIIIDWL